MDNSLRFLGIAKKAGLLEIGDESVSTAARSGRICAVLSAQDASDRSKRSAKSYAESGGAPWAVLPFSKAELSMIIGRGLPGVIAITDIGVAAKLFSLMALRDGEAFSDSAELLARRAARAALRRRESAVRKGNKSGKRRTRQ